MATANSRKQQQMEVMRALVPVSQAGSAQVPSDDSAQVPYDAALKGEKQWEAGEEGMRDMGSLPVWTSLTSPKEASTLRESRRIMQPIMAEMTEESIEYILATHNYAR